MKNLRLAALAALLFLLAACAQQPVQPPAAQSTPAADDAALLDAPHDDDEPKTSANLKLPQIELTPEILYKLLLGEAAAQRGQLSVAIPAYLDLARTTHDPRIAQRATELAWMSRNNDAVTEAAALWLDADPNSIEALQTLTTVLVGQARLTEAKPYLEKLLAYDKDNAGSIFLRLGMMLARHPDKPAVLQLLQDLAKPYGALPEAHFSVARAAANAGQTTLALSEVRAALKLRPQWEEAVLLQGQLLQLTSNDAALAYFQDYLEKNPRAIDVRLNYARLLVGLQRYEEARAQFQRLLQEFPQNPDVAMAVGMLSLQLKDYDAATTQFKQAISTGSKEADTARYYLGQIEEDAGRYEAARDWYAQIGPGEHFIASRMRSAGVLVKQGKLAEAQQYLQAQQAQTQNSQERLQFIQLEAQLLREAQHYREAYALLGKTLKKAPDSPELLYDHAMLAEKLGHYDVLEADLRKVIKLKPDFAHAYNALGYTFADRNVRLPEAYTLIEQALKLAPEDPFIIDSMGWVLYRMGKADASLTQLQHALDLRADPEIAAHFGEVLWSSGRHDEARQVWDRALKDNPGNDVLLATIKKFTP
jgi:tetratricopeptide (TPR) repeat protein